MLTHDYEKPEMPEPDGSMTIMMIGREVEIDTYRASTMVEYRDACVEAATAPLLARIAELERFKDAYDAWQEKTEWVQDTAAAGELGKHRADVLRKRIEKLQAALSAAPVAQPEPVAWCHLTPSGKVGYFDGKPMVMFGSVGNEHHETPLYAGIKDQP